MFWRFALGFVAGFSLAVTMILQIGTPAAFLVFICGFIGRSLGALAIKFIWGSDLPTLWKRWRPTQARFWRHAMAYIRGEHSEHDPLICNHCREAL